MRARFVAIMLLVMSMTVAFAYDEGEQIRTPTIAKESIEVAPAQQVGNSDDCPPDGDEERMLAKIAMAEAEGLSVESKALVMLTVLNRVQDKNFPDSIEGVIFQKSGDIYQYSPVGNGRYSRVEPDDGCWEALEMVMTGWDESGGALYFEVTRDRPTWHSRNLEKIFEKENVSFYK